MSQAPEIIIEDVHVGPQHVALAPAGVVFCDIDGTLANIDHRRIYVERKPKNWVKFKARMDRDTPIAHIIDALRTLDDAGWQVVLMSGRGEESRSVTQAWMARHEVPYVALYMRALHDYRRDDVVKEELLMAARLDGFDPTLVLDDRNQVVNMWRKHSIRCIQVAFGDF